MTDTSRMYLDYICDWMCDKGASDAADMVRALLTERDAAQAEVARLTAALAEAETRGAERMREAAASKLDEMAGGMRRIAEHPEANSSNANGLAALCEASAAAIRSLPPRERDGQEGE